MLQYHHTANVKQILIHLIHANIHFLIYRICFFKYLNWCFTLLPTVCCRTWETQRSIFPAQEKRQFVPWMTTIPNFEVWPSKEKGGMIVKNGVTCSLTAVFVVFVCEIQAFGGRRNSNFSIDGGSWLCGDLVS